MTESSLAVNHTEGGCRREGEVSRFWVCFCVDNQQKTKKKRQALFALKQYQQCPVAFVQSETGTGRLQQGRSKSQESLQHVSIQNRAVFPLKAGEMQWPWHIFNADSGNSFKGAPADSYTVCLGRSPMWQSTSSTRSHQHLKELAGKRQQGSNAAHGGWTWRCSSCKFPKWSCTNKRTSIYLFCWCKCAQWGFCQRSNGTRGGAEGNPHPWLASTDWQTITYKKVLPTNLFSLAIPRTLSFSFLMKHTEERKFREFGQETSVSPTHPHKVLQQDLSGSQTVL